MVDWHSFDWADIFRRLTLFAFRRRELRGSRGSLADAEDLAAEAIRRLLDSEYADWDPNREPDLLRQLGSIVNGLLSNELRNGRMKRVRSLDEPAVFDLAQQATLTEDKVTDGVDRTRVLSLLSIRIENDDVSRRLLILERNGVSKPALQAESLEVPIDVVYKARRRLAAHREAVRQELQSEASRRKERKEHTHAGPSR